MIDIELQFLGRGSAFHAAWGNTNAYFWADSTLCLLDCGSDAFGKLQASGVLENAKEIVVLMTHLHADHCGSLGTLIAYCKHMLRLTPLIVYPDRRIVELLALMGIRWEDYAWNESSSLKSSGVLIEQIPVEHSAGMTCVGYLISGKQRIFYSGDAERIPGAVLAELQKGMVDQVYQDCTYEEGMNPRGHCSLEWLTAHVATVMRNRVVCMHFGHNFVSKIREAGFSLACGFQLCH